MTPSLPRAPQIGSRQVVETLRKLATEVGGLKAFEPGVREAIGNTNWTVLMQRLDEADAALSRTAQAPVDVRKALEVVDQPDYRCPVCDEPFKAGDVCAMDIELGTCHAACLYGSPTVDLDTGEPVDGPIPTYPYEPYLPDAAQAPVADGVREANAEGPSEICQIDVEPADDGVVIVLHDGDTGWPAILDIQCAVELRDKLSVTLASSDPTPATETGGDEVAAQRLDASLAYESDPEKRVQMILRFLHALRQPKPQAVAVPDGWRLVPEKATVEMVAAFWRQKNTGTQEIGGTPGDATSDFDAYHAMIAASPTPTGSAE